VTRTAAEWREFWRDRGERELTDLLVQTWAPARDGDATRVATLLGSRAPAAAVTAELGRMRQGRAAPDGAEDAAAARTIVSWFEHA
jgi:hypothetical protein